MEENQDLIEQSELKKRIDRQFLEPFRSSVVAIGYLFLIAVLTFFIIGKIHKHQQDDAANSVIPGDE